MLKQQLLLFHLVVHCLPSYDELNKQILRLCTFLFVDKAWHLSDQFIKFNDTWSNTTADFKSFSSVQFIEVRLEHIRESWIKVSSNIGSEFYCRVVYYYSWCLTIYKLTIQRINSLSVFLETRVKQHADFLPIYKSM